MPLDTRSSASGVQPKGFARRPDSGQDQTSPWGATVSYLELQIRRAWRDGIEFAKEHLRGTLVILAASLIGVPVLAVLTTGVDVIRELDQIIAYGVIGPLAVLAIYFVYQFATAPGRIHAETSLVLPKQEPIHRAYAATIITTFVLGTVLVATIFLLSEHASRTAAEKRASSLSEQIFGKGGYRDQISSLKAALATKAVMPAPATQTSHATPSTRPATVGAAATVPSGRAPTVLLPEKQPQQPAAAPQVAQPTLPAPPYRLSLDQQRELIALLSPLSPKVTHSLIFWVPNEGDTLDYAEDFQRAFIRAGLQPSLSLQNPISPNETGVMLEVEGNTPKEITSAVMAAFKKVGISARLVNRPTQTTGAPIILFIGPQPL